MENRTVLFVEDDRVTRNTIGHMVKGEPYRARFAENGLKAVAILEAEDIDVVVTDLIMPEMDGLELLEWVQANKPEVVRVVVSGQKGADILLDAINRGSVYRYITKPLDAVEFRIVVRQSLEFAILQKDRQRLVTELEAANRKLHETVQFRTNQVLDLYNQAEIGKYAAQLVHNLNNPLQAIFGALDISQIALEPSPPDEELLNRMHGVLLRGAENLEKIIRAVLLHAKDRSLFQQEPVDINALVKDEMEFFNLNRVFKNDTVKDLDLQEDLPPVQGNYIQFKQIFDNLIKNAIDAMEAVPEKQLTINTRFEEGWVRFTVGDTGEGIEPENLENIFLPDFSTKPRDKGTGLGLASVRSMVSSYNGEIRVQSRKGSGAVFTVRLPAYFPPGENFRES